MSQAARGRRRTQAERSLATRSRLLEATVDCLVEYGYAGATVARIAERANVTRGAQTHHYQTKEQLVLAAVRHLVERRTREMVEQVDRLADDEEWVDSLLDILWELHTGPVFIATAEVWLAGRTDPQLAAHLYEVEQSTYADATANAGGRYARILADPELHHATYTAMDAMRGLVMSTWSLPRDEVEARWARLKRHLRLVFGAVSG